MKKIFLICLLFCLFLTGCTASNKDSFSKLVSESDNIQILFTSRYQYELNNTDFLSSQISNNIFNDENKIILTVNELEIKKELEKTDVDIEEYIEYKYQNIELLKSAILQLISELSDEPVNSAEYNESSVLVNIKIDDSNYIKIYGTGYVGISINDRRVFYSIDNNQWSVLSLALKEYIINEACNSLGCLEDVVEHVNTVIK